MLKKITLQSYRVNLYSVCRVYISLMCSGELFSYPMAKMGYWWLSCLVIFSK